MQSHGQPSTHAAPNGRNRQTADSGLTGMSVNEYELPITPAITIRSAGESCARRRQALVRAATPRIAKILGIERRKFL